MLGRVEWAIERLAAGDASHLSGHEKTTVRLAVLKKSKKMLTSVIVSGSFYRQCLRHPFATLRVTGSSSVFSPLDEVPRGPPPGRGEHLRKQVDKISVKSKI